jgi:hypothetical protein
VEYEERGGAYLVLEAVALKGSADVGAVDLHLAHDAVGGDADVAGLVSHAWGAH